MPIKNFFCPNLVAFTNRHRQQTRQGDHFREAIKILAISLSGVTFKDSKLAQGAMPCLESICGMSGTCA